jgi:sugar lactone lactonase YvrE
MKFGKITGLFVLFLGLNLFTGCTNFKPTTSPAETYPTVSNLAGQAGNQGSTNGAGIIATFSNPFGVAVDGSGNVYVGDLGNNLIRKITPAGVVSTLAGVQGVAGSVNGAGITATFSHPQGMAVDASGNVYVADTVNNLIRLITPAGVASTFAGSGSSGAVNGPVSLASFKYPYGVAVDNLGNVYVADFNNHLIRKISGGVVSTLAGQAGIPGFANGSGSTALFYHPQGVAVDGSGNVYVADTGNEVIREISPAGVVSTLAGEQGNGGSNNGGGVTATFSSPEGVVVDGSGNVYVADSGNNRIRKIIPGSFVSTYAGTGNWGDANGPATIASFNNPYSVALDASGNLYVGDTGNDLIRKIQGQ